MVACCELKLEQVDAAAGHAAVTVASAAIAVTAMGVVDTQEQAEHKLYTDLHMHSVATLFAD